MIFSNTFFVISGRMSSAFTLVALLLAASLITSSTYVFAQENKYEKPIEDTQENAQEFIRELQDVTLKYPLFAKRMGLVAMTGYRIPLLCVGGIDAEHHSAVQSSCIKQFIEQNIKPDYQYCLDFANRAACRPAVHALE